MTQRPTLTTERLVLRPLTPTDAPEVQRLAGAYEVALNTLTIPHPYPPGAAEEWIASTAEMFEKKLAVTLAITLQEGGAFAGAIGLVLKDHERAELGYWIGMPYWNRGFATEAGLSLIDYAFRELGLHRIEAIHFARNPASGRVLQKLALRHEGTQREAVRKWDEYLDVEMYGLLRNDWEKQSPES